MTTCPRGVSRLGKVLITATILVALIMIKVAPTLVITNILWMAAIVLAALSVIGVITAD